MKSFIRFLNENIEEVAARIKQLNADDQAPRNRYAGFLEKTGAHKNPDLWQEASRQFLEQEKTRNPNLNPHDMFGDSGRAPEVRSLLIKHSKSLFAHSDPEVRGAAWRLAQHADHDVKLQKHVLSHMKRANFTDPTDRGNLKLMTDRVRVNTGKKQVYGTQSEFHPVTGKQTYQGVHPPEHQEQLS